MDKRTVPLSIPLSKHRSYYSDGKAKDVVHLGKNATPYTIAHELFHKLDRGFKISSTLQAGLTQDSVALNVVSGGDIKEYLIKTYPNVFTKEQLTGEMIFLEKYRGISDILDGMSDGKVDYGYGHSEDYWKDPRMMEAEAWAQFGGIHFENDPEVMKLFELLFPNFSRNAIIALKGLM